jgi:hypothetical protein
VQQWNRLVIALASKLQGVLCMLQEVLCYRLTEVNDHAHSQQPGDGSGLTVSSVFCRLSLSSFEL